jgi:hypothetical protein
MDHAVVVRDLSLSPRAQDWILDLSQMSLDQKLPDYVSSGAGSAPMSVVSSPGPSVSQSCKQILEVDADMLHGAINALNKLHCYRNRFFLIVVSLIYQSLILFCSE